MNACPTYEPLLADLLFGDIGAEDRHRLEVHLADCAGCAAALQELEATLAWTAERQRPEPDPAYWNGYYARLETRMVEEARRRDWVGRVTAWLQEPGRLNVTALVPAPRWAVQVSGALVLVAVGMLLGWLVFRPASAPAPRMAEEPVAAPQVVPDAHAPEAPPVAVIPDTVDEPAVVPTPRAPQRPGAGIAPIRPASLDARTDRYLERSKVLLLGLINAEPEGGTAMNLTRKQEVARELVQESGGLQDELSAADRQRVQALIGDLEVILLQIANLESGYDLPAIELVKSGVERRGILLKINLTEMQRAAQDLPPADRPSVLPDSSTL